MGYIMDFVGTFFITEIHYRSVKHVKTKNINYEF
ncbi:hypothetical protein SAMN05216503_2806 [Polaribacter sp. KT25b]|nr:hypothetical protein SAMN05216503_2806 [Polaribacter sp. KT25b]